VKNTKKFTPQVSPAWVGVGQEDHLPTLAHVHMSSHCIVHIHWLPAPAWSVSLSGQLNRCFRLHVESLKKLGKQAQGCKMVTLWLEALRSCSLEHMTEPVTFWVRVKMDAARAGNKELQLK
jgi:hypothetical protein